MPVVRSVLITGAHRGFGRALTRAYLDAGAQVFPLVRKRSHAKDICQSDPARCLPLVGDVCQDTVMEEIVTVMSANGGQLDMLVNNAGTSGRGLRLDTLDAGQLRAQFELHCAGPMRCTKAALPFLESSGCGVVVNLSSRLGSLFKNAAGDFARGAFSYDYRIAKAAQNMLTMCLSQELYSCGVAVCAMHPGQLKTDSGSADASIDADTAAARFVEFFAGDRANISGRFFDLFDGELPW